MGSNTYIADDHTSEPSRQNAGGTGWGATVVTVTVLRVLYTSLMQYAAGGRATFLSS